jgi:hypothetical protein
VSELPKEAERLLAVAASDFVEARKKLVRTLRDEGRREEADAVAAIKKPSPVVLAVNRAARDRPQAAKDAAKAADRLGRAQLTGNPDAYRALVKEMDDASGLLSEVAVANISHRRSAPEAMRRRIADHIRGALSGKETRKLLVSGALTDEVEPAGFDAFAGLPVPKTRARPAAKRQPRVSEGSLRHQQKLRKEIAEARKRLAEADRRLRDATRERDQLAERLEKLDGRQDASP